MYMSGVVRAGSGPFDADSQGAVGALTRIAGPVARQMTDTDPISRCIAGVARSKDGRGAYQAQRSCVLHQLRAGTTSTIATMTAAAARRVGEAIARKAA